ncbi:hypothetical protein Ndes2526B_g00142 [Nannochloris sp. 'desiccata']|nr:hypothetical protein NADE_001996 [Chlorella desiccata (nom. nud.)]
MKRASSGPDDSKPRKGGIKWDEDNLEENERIKKELNPRKIDEPKTPYLSPQATEDEEEMLGDGLSPLSLDDKAAAMHHAVHAVHAVRTHKSPWSDSSDQNGGSPSPRAPNGNSTGNSTGSPSCSRSPRFSEEYYRDNSSSDEDTDDEDKNGGGQELENGGDGASEERKMKKSEKRKKFQEARKAHYGMKEALQKAKDLLEDEAEEDEEVGDKMVEENDN